MSGNRKKKNRTSTQGTLLYMPAILIIFGIVVYPMLYALVMSFTGYSVRKPVMNFVGMTNYIKILQDASFWQAVGRSLIFTFGSLIPQVVLGLAIAILLNHPDLRFKGLFRGLVIMPWLVPTVAVAMIFRWMFHDIYGIMNYILMDLHVLKEPVAWIANEHTAMFILILANVWRGVPMLITMFLAGLQGIPSDLYEAGQIDGANGWKRFSKITLPLLMPVVMVSGILRFIWTFNFYDLPWVMTGGGPAEATQTTPIYAYRRAFSSYRMGEGSAITMILFVILIIFAAIYFILKKRQDKGWTCEQKKQQASETDWNTYSGSGSGNTNYISRILAGGFGTAKSSDRYQASAFHPSSNIFPVFCEKGIYGIWNCPFPVEQYFYYGGFHHSYTGSCMPGRIQL